MPVYQLDDKLWFPDPHLGEEDGLVAVGGDLSVDRLLLAYSNGFFPWFSFRTQHQPALRHLPKGDSRQPFYATTLPSGSLQSYPQHGF